MYYLDYAKPVGNRYVLNFFADTIEDLKDIPTTTAYVTRNGTNYGVPLDTSVVTVVENEVRVNYVLQNGKYIVGGDIPPIVGTKTITENGTYAAKTDNLEGYSSVTVDVEPNLQEKSQIPNANPVTVEPDEGYYGLSKVTVNAVPTEIKNATPTKTAQTITPTSGKFLSEVSVEAIPDEYIVPTGSKDITTNGNVDVKAVAVASVNVQPKLQDKNITENGVVKPDSGYDGLSQVSVDVQTYTGNDQAVKYMVEGTLQAAGVSVPLDKTYIASKEYEGMRGISYLDIPNRVTEVASDAFYDCNPEIIRIPPQFAGDSVLMSDGKRICIVDGEPEPMINKANVIVPDNVEYELIRNIENLTIEFKGNAKTVVLENIKKIPYQGVSLGISGEIETVIFNNVEQIGKKTFGSDVSESLPIRNVEFGEGVKYIGEGAFQGNRNLFQIILPASLITIGSNAFDQTGINKQYLPGKVIGPGSDEPTINEYFAFIGESSKYSEVNAYTKILGGSSCLADTSENIVISDNIISIGGGSFNGCQNLKTVTIPSSVQWIGSRPHNDDNDGTFANCPALTTVYINGNLSNSEKPRGIFYNCPALTEIHYDGQVFTTADEFLEYGWPSSGESGSGSYGS